MAKLGWSSVRQVYRVTRTRTTRDPATKTNQTTTEVAYGITSLSRSQADAQRLLSLNRGHWGIENRAFYVRDEAFGEDRSRVRQGAAPQVLAAIRNAVLTLLRLDKVSNITATLRTFAWNSHLALTKLGILKQ